MIPVHVIYDLDVGKAELVFKEDTEVVSFNSSFKWQVVFDIA